MTTPLVSGPEEVVRGLLYKGEILVVGGNPSAGKTRNQLHMFYGLATGQEGWWGRYDPMPVLYCSQRSWRITSVQLRTVGITELPDNFQCFCVPDLNRTDTTSFLTHPLAFIHRQYFANGKKPVALALDTLYNFFPYREKRDFKDYNYMYNECSNAYRWTQEHDVAVSALHHASKQKEGTNYSDPMSRILGSQAILASAVACALIEKVDPNDNAYIQVFFMSHLEALPSPRYFQADRFTEVDAMVIADYQTKSLRQIVGSAEQKVLNEIPSDFLSSSIAALCVDKFGMSISHVYHVLEKLASKNLVIVGMDDLTNQKMAKKAKPA